MKSPVNSFVLRAVYFIFGGLPTLYLSALCIAFGQSELWAIAHEVGPDRVEAIAFSAVFGLAILGTASGWLAFFGVGISTVRSRTIHSLCIGAGILAAGLYAGQIAEVKGVSFMAPLIAVVPAVIGACLIFHLWRAAQQGALADGSVTALRQPNERLA